jgi:hypothetical protein
MPTVDLQVKSYDAFSEILIDLLIGYSVEKDCFAILQNKLKVVKPSYVQWYVFFLFDWY